MGRIIKDMLESTFKKNQRKELEAEGWKFITLEPGGGVPQGFPDTLCISPFGTCHFVEWKKSKNAKKQPLQEYWQKWLTDNGHDAWFVFPENINDWRAHVATFRESRELPRETW